MNRYFIKKLYSNFNEYNIFLNKRKSKNIVNLIEKSQPKENFNKELFINYKLILKKLHYKYEKKDFYDIISIWKKSKELSLDNILNKNLLDEFKTISFNNMDNYNYLKEVNNLVSINNIFNYNDEELDKLYNKFIILCEINNNFTEFGYLFNHTWSNFNKINSKYMDIFILDNSEIMLNNLNKFGFESIFNIIEICNHKVFSVPNFLNKILYRLEENHLFLNIEDIIKLFTLYNKGLNNLDNEEEIYKINISFLIKDLLKLINLIENDTILINKIKFIDNNTLNYLDLKNKFYDSLSKNFKKMVEIDTLNNKEFNSYISELSNKSNDKTLQEKIKNLIKSN